MYKLFLMEIRFTHVSVLALDLVLNKIIARGKKYDIKNERKLLSLFKKTVSFSYL